MNPDSTDGARQLEPEAPTADVAASSRTSLWIGTTIAVLLLVAAGWAWLDARRETTAFRSDVAQRLTAADAALAQSKSKDVELGNALRDAQQKIGVLESQLAESQSQQDALEALYRELAPSRDELALTEVEQVLVLANQQLALAGNVQAALVALQLADAKLGRMDLPRLTPLRRSLAVDMDELKAVPYVDVPGIAAKIDSALAMIDSLPLAKDERLPVTPNAPPPADEAPWLRFLREIWSDIKGLVRVETSNRPVAPLVTPAQSYFLRENLRLRLLSARLTLLSRDQNSFKADLSAANGWVSQYFDTRTKPVQSLSTMLTQLAASPMPATMPDLSRSLELVRTLKMSRVEPPERAQAPSRAK